MKKEVKIILGVCLIISIGFICSAGFVSASDTGWVYFINNVYKVCGCSSSCSASDYGADWIQVTSRCCGSGWNYLSETTHPVLACGAGVGKRVAIPASGYYYLGIYADGDSDYLSWSRVGVNAWGTGESRLIALPNHVVRQCVFSDKVYAVQGSDGNAQVWMKDLDTGGSTHPNGGFRLLSCIPENSGLTYCDGTAVTPDCCTETCPLPSAVNCGTAITSSPSGCASCSGKGTLCGIDYTCTAEVCTPNYLIGTSYWTNLKGVAIDGSQTGDTVRMVAEGSGFNQDINYSVWKTSGFLFFTWATPLSPISSSALWTSTDAADGVYFRAKIGSIENSSRTINIGSANDAYPVANITSPTKGFLWSVNYSLNFTQQSYDEDDLLKLEWNFRDNSVSSMINNYSILNFSSGNAAHIYNTSGTYIVKLKASEMTRNQSDEDFIKIYILKEGINVIPIISEPEDGVSLGDDRIVDFNAASSFVANCTKGSISPLSVVVGNLNCSYIHPPNSRTYPTSNYNITMNWTLTTENSPQIIRSYGDWSSRYNNVVEFTELFETGGKHTAYLDMSFELK